MKKQLFPLLFIALLCSYSLSLAYASTYVKYEYYNASSNSYSSIYEYRQVAQIFTVAETHDLHYVQVELGKIGNPKTAIVSIYRVASGEPTTPITSTLFDTLKIVNSPVMEWYQIDFITPIELNASNQYALVISAPNGNYTTNNILCWGTNSAGTYSNGEQVISSDEGQHWTSYSAYDCLFEEWGYIYQPPIFDAFPQFNTMILVGIICGTMGFSISQLGERLGDHQMAGFIIGGGIGLVICANSGIIPIWILTIIFLCASLGVYFWFKS